MLKDRRAFVFDLDGTLISSTPFYFEIIEKIFERNGLVLHEEDKRLAMGLSARVFLEPKISADGLSHALELLREQSARDVEIIPLFEGIKTLLEGLSNKGSRLAVWTSRDKQSATMLLEKLNILDFFDTIVSADCVTLHKPNPEGLHFIAKKWQCKAEEMVMVGDHDFDMIAAKRAGAMPIRAAWHGFFPETNCEYSALTMASVEQLAAALNP